MEGWETGISSMRYSYDTKPGDVFDDGVLTFEVVDTFDAFIVFRLYGKPGLRVAEMRARDFLKCMKTKRKNSARRNGK